MQPVAYSYKRGYRIVKKRSRPARFLKRTGHKRVRNATRQYLAHQDWDAVIEARPITDWDVC
jgi:hypothetical protein